MKGLYSLFAALCFLFFSQPAFALDCYWVVGSGMRNDSFPLAMNASNNVPRYAGAPLLLVESGGPANADIMGTIIRPDCGVPVAFVTVTLSGDTSLDVLTDAAGDYRFKDLATGGYYTITPSRDGDDRDGVNILDILAISRHILGIDPLPSAYRLIEADVNRSNSITTFDIVEIRKLILGIINEFPANTAWRFIPDYFVFPNPSNPFITTFPDTDTIAPLVGDVNFNYYAMKIGDVVGCGAPTDTASVKFIAVDRTVSACGDWVDVTVENFDDVAGFQFSMEWDETMLQYLQINIAPSGSPTLPGMDLSNFNLLQTTSGHLSMAWNSSLQAANLPDGTVLFRIQFNAIGNAPGTTSLAFTDDPTQRLVVASDMIPHIMLQDNGVLDLSYPLILSSSQVNVLCNAAATGSIDLTVTGDVTPYTYLWTDGATTQDISGLFAGIYTVTVTDANACSKTISVTITEPAVLTLTETQVNVLCNGLDTGSIDLTVSGGVTPYNYSWTGGATTEDRSGLAAGTYTVTVADANVCSKTTSVTIIEPAVLALTETHVDVLCNGNATGSINLSPSGGIAPYSYLWSNGATAQAINTLSAGTYTVTATDAVGCFIVQSAIVGQAPVLVATIIQVQNVLCPQDKTGLAQIAVSGGAAPYGIIWPGGNTSNLGVGSYTVSVTDANGCSTTTAFDIIATDNEVPTITCPDEMAICGANIVDYPSASAVDNCGVAMPPEVVSGPASGSIFLEGTTVIVFQASDNSGNTSSCSFSINVHAAPDILIDEIVNDMNGMGVGAISVTPVGSGGFTYTWNKNGQTFATTEDLTGLGAGTYSFTITDANSCTSVLAPITITNTVGVNDPKTLGSVRLWPNPAYSAIQLEIIDLDVVEACIVDLRGKLVQQLPRSVLSGNIEVAQLPDGVYCLKLSTVSGQILTLKFVKSGG